MNTGGGSSFKNGAPPTAGRSRDSFSRENKLDVDATKRFVSGALGASVSGESQQMTEQMSKDEEEAVEDEEES